VLASGRSVNMKYVKGEIKRQGYEISDILQEKPQTSVAIHGMIHNLRDMGDFCFVILRKKDGLVQCVYDCDGKDDIAGKIKEGCAVEITGRVQFDDRAPNGFEVHIEKVNVMSVPHEPMPVNINKKKLGVSLDTNLSLRPITLRNLYQRALFKMQEGVVRGFREYLRIQGFTEIRSPKIVASGAEGGANIFKLDYFGQKAYLAQSPQFYKQTMVGVYERVMEVGPVFRAEKHNTTRHLNEYTSMDFEMGFIDSFGDIMDMETGMLRYMFDLLKNEYSKQLELLGVELPEIKAIPQVRFAEAKVLVSEKYGKKIKDPYDLTPEEEQLIGQLFKEEYDSDFVFVTHYPSKKRPFYAMDDPEDNRYTLSFDLLFRGMEITTGGQRIHDYQEQVNKMISKNMNPEDFSSYLMIHKYGIPPHGGLGIGLERLCMKIIGENNVRFTTMFPRDMTRLEP
jgi:nondiscriminating aspartyl-tRNA synthetase